MRPLELVVEGVRSYATRQEIDFRQSDLLAIVGDTGAGKSSLLEAICFALYGSSSWNSRAVKELITHGCEVMKVRLRFVADGREWEVERTAARGPHPRPITKLACAELDIKLDRKKDVDSKIQELVGLDYKAFLGAVILPQGRFQKLLQATPAERARILKGIFRLDVIDQMRGWAEIWMRERAPRLATLQAHRAKLHQDPEAEARRARQLMTELDGRLQALESARQAYQQAAGEASGLAGRITAIAAACQVVRDAEVAAIGEKIAGLLAKERQIGEQKDTLAREMAKLQGEHRQLTEGLEKRQRGGLDIEGLTRAKAKLERLLELDDDVKTADLARAEWARRASELEKQLQDCTAARERAEREWARAQTQRDAAQTEDIAAHLAADLQPGDTCPVCQREIPAALAIAPEAKDRLARADRALKQARRDREKAQKDQQQLDGKLGQARDRVAQNDADRTQAQTSIAEVAKQLPENLRPGDSNRASVERLLTEVGEQKSALDAEIERRAELEQDLDSARTDKEALDRRLLEEVTLPARDVRNQLAQCVAGLQRLRQALDDGAALEPSPEDAPVGADLASQQSHAERVQAIAAGALDRAGEFARALGDKKQSLETRAGTALAGVDCDSVAALERRFGEAETERKHAEQAFDRASAEIAPARSLDARIASASALLRSVEELRKLLSDAKFVSYAIERKQLAMLSVASRLLSDMTGGRFGFTGDFQIVDKPAGEARSTDTLSGGETFLASLALALALVELANRSGGRLDALFLDEGFGALDTDALEQAITALTSQAERGRLVVIISHLQAVAENIDRVLYIVPSSTGSKAHMLDRQERSRFDTESAGLLA